MTQINDINKSTVVQTGQRQSSAPAAGFQSSLEIAIARGTGEKAESGQTAALCEPSAANLNPAVTPSADDIVCQTDSLLSLLESYSVGLENPGATLKDLAPILDRIKDGAQQLMDSADRSTSAGSELKDIASKTALAASIEYIKFQRGDYI